MDHWIIGSLDHWINLINDKYMNPINVSILPSYLIDIRLFIFIRLNVRSIAKRFSLNIWQKGWHQLRDFDVPLYLDRSKNGGKKRNVSKSASSSVLVKLELPKGIEFGVVKRPRVTKEPKHKKHGA